MKKAMILLADGFEDVEAFTVVDLLRRARITCDMISMSERNSVTASHGITVTADVKFTKAELDSYQALILPGGLRGTDALREDFRVLQLVRDYHDAQLLTAAICAAPTVFGRAGILEEKRACCYPGLESGLIGAEVCYDPVVVDGNIVTSRGLGTALPFALTLVRLLAGEEEQKRLAGKIVYSGPLY